MSRETKLTSIKLYADQLEWLQENDVNLSATTRLMLDLIKEGTLTQINGDLTLTPANEDELCDLLGVDDLDDFSGTTIPDPL